MGREGRQSSRSLEKLSLSLEKYSPSIYRYKENPHNSIFLNLQVSSGKTSLALPVGQLKTHIAYEMRCSPKAVSGRWERVLGLSQRPCGGAEGIDGLV